MVSEGYKYDAIAKENQLSLIAVRKKIEKMKILLNVSNEQSLIFSAKLKSYI